MDNTYNIDFIARCIAGHNKTDIAKLNENIDIIDSKLKEHSDALELVDIALDSKQDSLAAVQLAAVNSGITSEDVAQIETNKNNILTVANYGGGINKLNPVPMFTSGQYAVYNATTNTYSETVGHLDSKTTMQFVVQGCTGTSIGNFTVVSTLVISNVSRTGKNAWLFTKLNTFNKLYIGHNG